MTKQELPQTQIVNFYINESLNNTIITVTDISGNVKLSRSLGSIGYKGMRRWHFDAIEDLINSIKEDLSKLFEIEINYLIFKGILKHKKRI
jgi:ribosomal protein S11